MISLSRDQKSILFGIILGDGYLQSTGKNNARLRLEHGYQQKEYLFWKIEKLHQLFQGKPVYLERVHPLTKKTYKYWRHQSQSTPYLGKIRKLFYPEGKKMIPDNLEEYINPQMFAVWYMDDGYYYLRDKCGYLYLGNVSEKEANVVSLAIFKKFNIQSKVKQKKKGFAIYFPRTQVEKLKLLIKNHIIDYFNYKIPS
ncbi:MAG: LAGLIDADG endonuclease [Candidatus Levybacteria bacterium]|nr:LAGLIDADG endonuclease [Candidatus Levybacteria bacterium]